MKNEKSRRAGFTIAELILVIAIIGVLFAIGGNTYRNQRSSFQFNDSLTQVLGIVKTARNHAVASRGYWDGSTNIIPKEGYGVYIEKNGDSGRFILFANMVTPSSSINQYDVNEGDSTKNLGFEEEYLLPKDTVFKSLTGDGISINRAVIIFRPPLADAFIAVNPNILPETVDDIVKITDLTIELQRLGAPDGVPNKVISINKIAGFPEINL